MGVDEEANEKKKSFIKFNIHGSPQASSTSTFLRSVLIFTSRSSSDEAKSLDFKAHRIPDLVRSRQIWIFNFAEQH